MTVTPQPCILLLCQCALAARAAVICDVPVLLNECDLIRVYLFASGTYEFHHNHGNNPMTSGLHYQWNDSGDRFVTTCPPAPKMLNR